MWRVFSLCHDRRNRSEYEGHTDIGEQLVGDLIRAARELEKKVADLV